jgi:hypothetical protein
MVDWHDPVSLRQRQTSIALHPTKNSSGNINNPAVEHGGVSTASVEPAHAIEPLTRQFAWRRESDSGNVSPVASRVTGTEGSTANLTKFRNYQEKNANGEADRKTRSFCR